MRWCRLESLRVRTSSIERTARRLVLLTAVTIAAMAGSTIQAKAQGRQSGAQLTPDSQLYLISKDVGNERWAITYDAGVGIVTGNVFSRDGAPPQFISCERTATQQAPDPSATTYDFSCRFAVACASAPCVEQWGAPFPVNGLPGSFLLPSDTKSTLRGNVQPIFTGSCATSSACHGVGGRAPILAGELSHAATFNVPALQDSSKPFVAPFDSQQSYLFDKVLGIASSGQLMPLSGPPLSAEQTEAIRAWIAEGAVNN